MAKELHRKATVLPGGKVEIFSPALEAGQVVDVSVRCSRPAKRRSAVDILAEAPGHRLFRTGEEVDRYIREERVSWNR